MKLFTLALTLFLFSCTKQELKPAKNCSKVITSMPLPSGGYSVIAESGTYFSFYNFKVGEVICND